MSDKYMVVYRANCYEKIPSGDWVKGKYCVVDGEDTQIFDSLEEAERIFKAINPRFEPYILKVVKSTKLPPFYCGMCD